VNITGHVSLVVGRGSQIGSAESESIIVTAADVAVAIPSVSRELLEVGIQFFFVLALADLLDQEEGGTNDDGNANYADNGEGGTHGRLVLQETESEVSIAIIFEGE
jgi:hypothetical protein